MKGSEVLAVAAAAAGMALWASGGSAQDWPTRQIKVIVPFTAGSATDVVARAVFEQIGKEAGQSVVVENRTGAGTTIGSAAVAKSDPDGYTILVNSTSHVVVASTFSKITYNVAEDFVALSGLAAQPFVVTTRTKYRTMADFTAAAKASPGAINYGSAGVGTSGMLFCEQLAIATGTKMTHVPFRGTPEAMTEIVADRLDMYPGPVTSVLGLAAEKKVAVLAVSTPKRAKALPNVPTLQETGIKGADYSFWAGAFAPAKTPKAIAERMNAAILKALDNPDVAKRIDGLGAEPMPMQMAAFDTFIRAQIKLHADIIAKAGIKPQ